MAPITYILLVAAILSATSALTQEQTGTTDVDQKSLFDPCKQSCSFNFNMCSSECQYSSQLSECTTCLITKIGGQDVYKCIECIQTKL